MYGDNLDVAQGALEREMASIPDTNAGYDYQEMVQKEDKLQAQAFLNINGINWLILQKRSNGMGIKEGLMVRLKCPLDYSETGIRIGI